MIRRLRSCRKRINNSEEEEEGNNNNSSSSKSSITTSTTTTRTTMITLDIRETILDEIVVKEIADLILLDEDTSVDTVHLDDCGAYFNKETSRLAIALGYVKNVRLSETPTFLSHSFLDTLFVNATRLQNLKIQDRLQHGFQIQALSNGLAMNHTLKCLDLSKSRIDHDDIVSLFPEDFGFVSSSIESLILRSLNLGDEQVTHIANSLKNNQSIRKLDISFNQCRNMDSLSCCNNLREIIVGYQFIWQSPKINISGFANALQQQNGDSSTTSSSFLTTLALPRNKARR